jgi:energy-coupling factor transporter ATP-binding protein EcfA2
MTTSVQSIHALFGEIPTLSEFEALPKRRRFSEREPVPDRDPYHNLPRDRMSDKLANFRDHILTLLRGLSEVHYIESDELHEVADRIVKIIYRAGKRVAVLGGLGVGKSTLINGLVGIPRLCATSGGQETCTKVAMSYQYLDDGDGKKSNDKVVALIQFITMAEVSQIVAMHGASIRTRIERNGNRFDDKQAMEWIQSVADIASPGQNMRTYIENGFRAGNDVQCLNRVEGLAFMAIQASQSEPTQAPSASTGTQDPLHAAGCAKIDCEDVNSYTSAISKYANGTHTCIVK